MIAISRTIPSKWRKHLVHVINHCNYDLTRINAWVEVCDVPATYNWPQAAELTWPDGHIALDDDDRLLGWYDWLGRALFRTTLKQRRMTAGRQGEWFRGVFSHAIWHVVDYQILDAHPAMGLAIAKNVWGKKTWADPHRHQTAGLFQKAYFDHAQDAPFTTTQVKAFKKILA